MLDSNSTVSLLLAEDEPTAMKNLVATFSSPRYKLTCATDGNSALKKALAMTEPYIAVLDWLMPEVTGLQICAVLRSPKIKIRPYLIMVSARSTPSDIAKALDAGADDFLVKPFRPAELQARLRVAERTLNYQSELREQLNELEDLRKRYRLIADIMASQGGGRAAMGRGRLQTSSTPVEPLLDINSIDFASMAEAAASGTTPKETPKIAKITTAEVDGIMIKLIAQQGFGKVGAIARIRGELYPQAQFTAWGGMLLEEGNDRTWVDILLEVDSSAMGMIFEQSLGRLPESEEERKAFLASTQMVVISGFKTAFENNGAAVMAPFLSRVVSSKECNTFSEGERETYRYALAGGSVGITIVRQKCPILFEPVIQLKVADVSAQDYPPAQGLEVPMIMKSTIITERYIRKFESLDESSEKPLAVPIYRASLMAVYFSQLHQR